ncbi:hypothetical protein NQD34_014608 [Periophthalmus magnuspinnatus]|nr:hypothetical protein NQD34_014608 [Periophthalmus magnuspinnatus]
MHTRKRVPSTVTGKSRESEPKRWVSPRKRRRTDYASVKESEDCDSSSDCVEETSEEVMPKSDDKSNHEEEEGPDKKPAETSEDQTDVQNEQTKDFTIDIESTESQRKPLLILHRLEHLQGDFHLLLNNVVLLQNDSGSTPTQNPSEEKADASEDDTPGPVETSEPQDETSSHCSNAENEEQDEVEQRHIEEDAVISEDQGVGTTSVQEVIIESNGENEVEIVALSFQTELESVEEEATPENVISLDCNAQQQQTIESPPQEENPSTASDEPAATPQTSAEVDIADLEQLKREKIKWQIKVLKLQEEYYTLQIQKLKQ